MKRASVIAAAFALLCLACAASEVVTEQVSMNSSGISVNTGRETPGSPAVTVSDAKSKPNNVPVIVSGGVVSAIFPSSFYFQQDGIASPDRACGVQVVWSGAVSVGKRYVVKGVMKTNLDGERYVEATAVDPHTPEWTVDVKPLGMTNKAVGGADWHYCQSTGAGQMGVSSGTGLNNVGLLIRCWGKFMHVDQSHFQIDDGSEVILDCEATSSMIPSPTWRYVIATGVSSCRRYGDELNRLLRVTSVEAISSVPNVTGRWQAEITTGPRPGVYGMLLTQQGNAVFGTVREVMIVNGQMSGTAFFGEFTIDTTVAEFFLTQAGEVLSGTWKVHGETFPMCICRATMSPITAVG